MAKWSLAAWLGVSEEEVARMRAEADLRERTKGHLLFHRRYVMGCAGCKRRLARRVLKLVRR